MRFKVGKQQPVSFRAAALYLAGQTRKHREAERARESERGAGRSGGRDDGGRLGETSSPGSRGERVLWVEERGLGTTDPEDAARIMAITAERSQRVRQPALHFIVAFDPKDARRGRVDPDSMREIAGELTEKLGLNDYQMLIYAHGDREHPHLHFLVNRVHPETGRAWSQRNIGRRLTTLCREIAEERGLNALKERSRDREHERGHADDRTGPVPDGEYRTAQREGREPKAPFDREALAELKTSLAPAFREETSWANLSGRLAAQGLYLRAKGQGLIVTDGRAYAKLSQLGKTVRLKELEDRFGERFADYYAREAKDLVTERTRDGSTRSEADSQSGPTSHEDRLSEAARRHSDWRETRDTPGRDRGDLDSLHRVEAADFEYRRWALLDETLTTSQKQIQQAERTMRSRSYALDRNRGREVVSYDRMLHHMKTLFANPAKAHARWAQLERELGVGDAAELVRKQPGLVGGHTREQKAHRSGRITAKSWEALTKARTRWRDAQAELEDTRQKAIDARHAAERVRSNYRHLQAQVGDRDLVKRYLQRSIRLRARALDRVNHRMFEKSRLADERIDQLHRAWRKHNERERERERERGR
ncbi:relaxase/mobilization nuclease domain-containing protein [Amorphus sp. MBR-141]